MKKILCLFFSVSLLCLSSEFLQAQEQKKELERQTVSESPAKTPTYNPAGRRDPFKDLLGGREVKERVAVEGVPQLSIDDINLIGIVKAKGKLTAIISSPQGFPYPIKEGDNFSDGFVLSIQESQVVFRKTNERGIPLIKPKDIIKEIYPEER